MMQGPKSITQSAFAHAMLAYLLWGLLPAYFKLLPGVAPLEILSNRILWSLLLVLAILAARGQLHALGTALAVPRTLGALALSASLIAVNWLVYIWSVAHAHVVAASLGYFLNPLVNVLLGVTVLGERLNRRQWLAICVAASGVLVMAAEAPEALGISLTLAFSFALYALVRKKTLVMPLPGLAAETLLLTIPAGATLLWLSHSGGGLAFGHGTNVSLLLVASGAITSIPLLLFASGARKLTMVTLGLLQYLAPTMQFALGVLVYGETLTPARWASFGLIWLGLALFVWDALARRRAPRTA